MSKACTAKQILNIARSQIGFKEYPAGTNTIKYNTAYYGEKVSGGWYPWCAAFQWWLFREAKSSELFYGGNKSAYCPALEAYYKKNKQTVSKANAKPGDIVLFDWDFDGIVDHVGIIEKVNKDGTFTTIEGNTAVGNDSNGGAVMRRIRNISYVKTVCRPKYASKREIKDMSYCGVYPKKYVKFGSNGKNVRRLQRYLGWRGYRLNVDGIFGEKTKNALLRFQKNHNLKETGVCDKNTIELMKKLHC